jgi:CRP-like cAMP-binding protein
MDQSTSTLQGLFHEAQVKRYPKGQILVYEGDPTDNIFLVDKGYVKVYNILTSGVERIIFIYGEGDIFPLTSYLSGARVARYFYECMTEVEVQQIKADTLGERLHNEIAVGEALLYYVNSANQEFFRRIDILAVNDAKRKVVALFAFLVNKTGGDGPSVTLNLPLTSQDVADLCGITRETASVQLHRLRKEGMIAGYKEISINIEKLAGAMKKLDIAG